MQEREQPPALLDSLTTQQTKDVLGAVNDAEDFDAVFERAVKNQNPLKACNDEQAKSRQVTMWQLRIPAHLRLCREKRKGLIRQN